MAVYRILVKKRLRHHAWSNTYIIVSAAPYSQDELVYVADKVAHRFVAFERHFYSEEVQLTETITTPLLNPPITNTFAQRPAASDGRNWHSLPGLRPIAVEESLGSALTLVLGLQPVANRWGRKYYRYALRRDEVQTIASGYQLTRESLAQLQQILATAKKELLPLLQSNSANPSFAISTSQHEHNPEVYKYRYVRDITIKGVHILK